MDELIRSKIVGIIETWIRENGDIPLRLLKSILKQNNIPESIIANIQPKHCISTQFPEFIIVGTNGHEHIARKDKTPHMNRYMSDLASLPEETYNLLRDTLISKISSDGKYLLCNIPGLLPADVDWKKYASGKTMYDWILSIYPGLFKVSDDKLSISLASDSITPTGVSLDQETKNYLYKFCYFPSSSVVLKQIKELTGDNSISHSTWVSQRTQALSQSLLGLNGGMLDDSDGIIARLAFFTGLKTENNQDIYGILEKNPNEDAPQKWIFATIAYPGQNTVEGHWLCNKFGIKSQAAYDDDRAKAITDISDALNAVLEIQSAISDTQENIHTSIEEGRMLSDLVSTLVLDYIDHWNEIKKGVEKLEIDRCKELNTTISVQQFMDEANDTNRVQENLLQKYTTLVQKTWDFMTDNSLCSENRSSEDIAAVSDTLHKNITAETVTQLRQLMEPYQSLMVLRSIDPSEHRVFDDAEYNALDAINEHFGAHLKVNQLKYSIQDKEIDMSFLGLLLQINELIVQIENRHNSHQENESVPVSDVELLNAALDGTLWKISNRAFKKPDPLETAIMLCDHKSAGDLLDRPDELYALGYDLAHVKKMVEDIRNAQLDTAITPLHAAKRLIQLVGRSSESVDQCLLFGIMQYEAGAAETLMHHYLETDRLELATILFYRFEKTLPDEYRQQILLTLVLNGCISGLDAISRDILLFLTDSGIQLTNSVLEDESSKIRLQRIYQLSRPTFIHHIVFLSPELQGYILSPENVGEINGYCPDKRSEDFSNLLRQNTYERGNTPLQVAKRIYSFIGNWNDLALDIAQFSADDSGYGEFIFDLLVEKEDDKQILRFLDEHPLVKDAHLSEYFDILYRNHMYSEVCNIVKEGLFPLSTTQTIQSVLAFVRTGSQLDTLPEFDIAAATKEPALLCEASEEIFKCDRRFFEDFIVRIFPKAVQVLDERELSHIATAGNAISDKEIREFAGEISDRCAPLAIYYGLLTDSSEFSDLRDSYLSERFDSLSSLDADLQKEIAHELRILDPGKYATLEENVFEVQLLELLEKDLSDTNKAIVIAELLKNSNISDNVLGNAVTNISSNVVICHAPLYKELRSKINNEHIFVDFLIHAYTFWNEGNDEFKIFLCNQIMEAMELGIIPDDYLVGFEDCILATSNNLDIGNARLCVLHMEEKRNREPYLSFIRNITGEHSDNSFSISENGITQEMTLFCDALEDDKLDITDYLQYCSGLVISSEQNLNEDGAYADVATLTALRELYQRPKSADNWDAVERMIPQSRIRARGIVLFFYAYYLGNTNAEDNWLIEKDNDSWTVGKANVAWERCLNYCMSEDQDDLFFKAARSWLQEINQYYVHKLPWYSTKHYMQTMQKILEVSDTVLNGEYLSTTSFPVCSEDIAVPLVKEAIDVFKRIDKNKTDHINGDDNHNSLRVIIELSLRLDCENLLLETLSEELFGPYINLCLVLVFRLLFANKTDVAMRILRQVVDSSVINYNYSHLVNILASMESEEELSQWMSIESNRATLRFILPNGNAPDILRLQTLVMNTFEDNHSLETSVKVIENIIDCYPRDTMSFKSLFIMCKENYIDYLPHIYKALVGVYRNYHAKPRNMYTRDRFQILIQIEILRQVMESLGHYEVEYELAINLIRDYHHENDRKSPDDLVSMLNQVSDEIRSLFVGVNKTSTAYSLLIKSLLASVTENWAPFFREAYQTHAANLVNTFRVGKYSSRGLLRGILRVWRECSSDEERLQFISWINVERELESESVFSKLATKQLNNLVNKVAVQSVNWSMLRLPWEEHFVCLGNLKDLGRYEKNCCYKVMMAERLKGQSAKDSFVIMVRLAQDNLKAQLLYGNAADWFKKANYDLAGAAYQALYITRILPTKDSSLAAEFYEKYETWMRISYVFAGVDLVNMNCSPHSCMNMICALINEGYTRYFDRLRVFFTNGNLCLFKAVRKVLSTSLNEEDTYNQHSDFRKSPTLCIAYLHFILSRDQSGRYLFLSDRSLIESASSELFSLESALSEHKKANYWIRLQYRPVASAFPVIEADESDFDSITESYEPDFDFDFDFTFTSECNGSGFNPELTIPAPSMESGNERFLPRCYSEVAAFATGDNGQDIQTLLEEYHRLTAYSDDDCSQRLRLSALICTRSNPFDGGDGEKNLVRFGINYYKYHCNRVKKNIDAKLNSERVHSTMFDLAVYGLQTPSANTEIILSLPNWLQYSIRRFSTVDQLLQDYAKNRSAYASIIKLLSDTEYSDAANSLFEALNHLLSVVNRVGVDALDIKNYQIAQSRLSEANLTRDWIEMFSALNEMLRHAINKLDQRPSLKITIFNEGVGLQYDGLYGEVENTGRETAYRLEMQATFPNNDRSLMSALYRLQSLRPNEKATFAISYKTADPLTELEYILNLNYSYKEERCSVEPLRGLLSIVEYDTANQSAVAPQFETQRASTFFVDENGEVISKDFKGRKTEIQSLTSLLTGDDFSDYRSAIVQGIKRSGKTSLLNYLRTYIRFKKSKDVIHLFVDGQYINKPIIYKAFFQSVLDRLPLEYPQISLNPGWSEFIARWTREENGPDIDPGDMNLFYRQLYPMLDGKGLYLIIDEFDNMLEKLDKDAGFDPLLQVLRSLQMDPDCLRSIHMVLCGSNQLLIYNRTGSALNQMFQSYETIPVGQMLVSDIHEMILDWLDKHPFINFASAADGGVSPSIKWIEHYTGGLVWYTRLLVNEAIRIVLTDKRNCVYPSDISAAFNSVCTRQNCRQLIEGCGTEDQIVLDAMQSLSPRPGMYVSYEQLMHCLENHLSAEQVRKSLITLTESVELLERKSPSTHSYRFRIELYRRYFRTREWLDNLESRFGNNSDSTAQSAGDCFTIVESKSNIETTDSNSAFDFA